MNAILEKKIARSEKKRKEGIAEKKKITVDQRERLDKMFAMVCRTVSFRDLCAIRNHKDTKKLNRQNYAKFIRVVDKLTEAY